MDVQLPNGVTISGVPDNFKKLDVIQLAIRNGLAKPEDFPVENSIANSPNPANIKGAEDVAVQNVADSVTNPINRYAIGAEETMRTAGGRVASALSSVLPNSVSSALGLPQEAATAEQNRQLTSKVKGITADIGRAVPAMLGGARFGGNIGSAIGSGAAIGALTSGDNAAQGAVEGAVGSGLGYGVGNVVGRAANAAAGQFAKRAISGTDDSSVALRKAQDLGFRFTPGTAADSRVLRSLDAAMTSNPITSSPYSKLQQHNTQLLNQLATRAMGVEANDLGPSSLAAIDQHLSNQFDAIAGMIPKVDVEPSVKTDLHDILPASFLKNYSTEIADGSLSGKSYMAIRSRLLQVTRSNSDKSDNAWDVINALDDSMSKDTPGALKYFYNKTREQYKVLVAVEKYANNIKGGDLKEGNLNNSLRKVFGKSYSRGRGASQKATNDFMDAVMAMSDPRVGAPFGNSGTADRLLPWAIVSGLALHPTPETLGAAAAGVVGSHALLGAPSQAASQIGAGLGRGTPQVLNELQQ